MEFNFKYFLNPEKYAVILGKSECDICHKVKECFDGSVYYGEEEFGAFCFECVSKGRLLEVGAFSCDPDVRSLKEQLKQINKDLPDKDIERIKNELTDQLIHSTPKFPTWQDWAWPCHCGDYCQFISLAGKEDFNELAEDKNGKNLFGGSLNDRTKENTDIENVWKDLKNGHININEEYSPMAYIFRCIICNKIITEWDCD